MADPANWMQLATYISNTLGVDLVTSPRMTAATAHRNAASILKKTAAKRGVTIEQLVAATNWMRSQSIRAKGIASPFYYLAEGHVVVEVQEPNELAKAIAHEEELAQAGDQDAAQWSLRLARTRGAAQLEALADWKRERTHG